MVAMDAEPDPLAPLALGQDFNFWVDCSYHAPTKTRSSASCSADRLAESARARAWMALSGFQIGRPNLTIFGRSRVRTCDHLTDRRNSPGGELLSGRTPLPARAAFPLHRAALQSGKLHQCFGAIPTFRGCGHDSTS